jgi:hypothetical protein
MFAAGLTLLAFASGIGAVLLAVMGPAAAIPFVLLHGGGNGLLTIARGTLPLALFGPAGYGLRTGQACERRFARGQVIPNSVANCPRTISFRRRHTLRSNGPDPAPWPFGALARAAASIDRLDQAFSGHVLAPALLYRARLKYLLLSPSGRRWRQGTADRLAVRRGSRIWLKW